MRLLLRTAGLLWIAACSPDDGEPAAKEEHRTVTVPGETCGDWRAESEGTRIIATCDTGMSCRYDATVVLPGELGDHYGICREEGALECGPEDACPDAWVCRQETGPAKCLYICEEHADCPGAFQVCDREACVIRSCTDDDSECLSGSACVRGVCVAGASP